MIRTRTLLSTASFALAAVSGVTAQAGVADLRYAAPLPGSVVFTAVDTLDATITGLPTGESKLTTITQWVSDMQFASGDSGIAVTAALKSFSGTMRSAVGDLQMNSPAVDPIRFQIGVTGAAPGALAGPDATALSAAPEETLAKSRVLAGLYALPGRTIPRGESWSDSARTSQNVGGMQVDNATITHGTYLADSVVDGRTLNVLRVISESTTTTTGTHQGMEVTQKTIGKVEEFVLWDSTRHIPVSRNVVSHIESETALKQMNVTMKTVGTSRTYITGEARN